MPRPRRALDIATRAIHAGRTRDPATGAVLTPVHQNTTYAQSRVGEHQGFTYTRCGNPTVAALEHALGALEDALPALCFGTGLAAITGLALGTLRAGDEVVVSRVVYGGTVRLLREVLAPLDVRAVYVDTARPGALNAALTGRTRLVLVETPANPTLVLTDLADAAATCRRAGVTLAVDNTFLTPVLQRPLDLGADVSIYSTTKHIEGHNATVGGALITRDAALYDRLRLVQRTIGAVLAPWEAWLTLRGLSTLPLRLERHSASALAVARWLEQDPRIARVFYPGLDSCPQRELARRQHAGDAHGGVLAFELAAGNPIRFMNALSLCIRAENLGSVETLATHPASMTHASLTPAQREAAGITDGLVRLSVGLESPADIIDDLDRALTATSAQEPSHDTAVTADRRPQARELGAPARA